MEPNPTAPPLPGSGSSWVPPPSVLSDVWSVPWVIQALAVIFILTIAAQAFPKILGPWQSTVEGLVNGRRRTKAAGRDADVSALSLQVDNMQTVLEETRAELAMSRSELAAFRAETRTYQQKHDETLGLHSRWDRGMIQLVVSLGGTPLPPMPLYPDVPGTPDRMRDMPGDGGVTDLDHP